MDKNSYTNLELPKNTSIKKSIKEIYKKSESEIPNDAELDEKLKMVQYTLDGIGIKVKNKGYNIIEEIFNLCDSNKWDFERIDNCIRNFKSLEDSIYRRNVEKGEHKESEFNYILLEYFKDYIDLNKKLHNGEISNDVYNTIYNSISKFGFSISETLTAWKHIDELPFEDWQRAIGDTTIDMDEKIENLKTKLLSTMCNIAGLTLASTPLDVFNVFNKTHIDNFREVRFNPKDSQVLDAVNNVLGNLNSWVDNRIEEQKKNGKNKRIGRKKIREIVKKAKDEFISNWKENQDKTDKKLIFIGDDKYLDLKKVLDLFFKRNLEEQEAPKVDSKKIKKIKKAVEIKGFENKGFARNLNEFFKFSETLMYYVKPYKIEKRYKSTKTIYDLLALYRNNEHNLAKISEILENEEKTIKIKTLGTRIAIVLAAGGIFFGSGYAMGKSADNKQIGTTTETTVGVDDSTADSNGGQVEDSETNMGKDHIPVEVIDRMKEFRERMETTPEGKISSEENEEYKEEGQDDCTAQYNEASDEEDIEEEPEV